MLPALGWSGFLREFSCKMGLWPRTAFWICGPARGLLLSTLFRPSYTGYVPRHVPRKAAGRGRDFHAKVNARFSMSTEPSQPSESAPASSPPRPSPQPQDGGQRGGGGLSSFAQEALKRAKAVTASSGVSSPLATERPERSPDVPRPASQSAESSVVERSPSDPSGSSSTPAATTAPVPSSEQPINGSTGGSTFGSGRPRGHATRPMPRPKT